MSEMSSHVCVMPFKLYHQLSLSSYMHHFDSMTREQWENDIAYAMTPFKLITWPIGAWPLQVYNFYSLIRCAFGICCGVCIFRLFFRRYTILLIADMVIFTFTLRRDREKTAVEFQTRYVIK